MFFPDRTMKKILWICGRLPTPLFSGDALYSAGILTALATTQEVALSVVGVRRDDRPIDGRLLGLPQIRFVDVAPSRRRGILSLLSSLPRDAYSLATGSRRRALVELMSHDWDWIVFDHANSAGFMPLVRKLRNAASICYIAHNAEGKIRPEIAVTFGNPVRRAILRWDAEKYRKLEQNIVKAAAAIVCITEADATYFAQSGKAVFVVPPVYLGTIAPAHAIDPNRPRSILLLGSFEWIAKQRNLEHIINVLLPRLKRSGIILDVVGTVPDGVKNRYAGESSTLIFHGPVPDLSRVFARSRGGLVAEVLGGGFKLKLLDYAFARLPIFGLKMAVEGTTADEQSAMFIAEDLNALADTIVENIDDLTSLNRSQAKLFELISERFGLKVGIDHVRGIFLRN
jgi:glycosyltransferase involved in cell wall biosynthesis